MRTLYNDMDIHFSLEGGSFHALNIVFEHFERTIPSHNRAICVRSYCHGHRTGNDNNTGSQCRRPISTQSRI